METPAMDGGDGGCAGEADASVQPRWVQVEKGMLSRLLFPNPVCLLSTQDEETGARNVMTITWLTPINNQGGFICSMNRNRHSASFVNRIGAHFVLNIPVAGMEETVLAIGGCSGATVDKFAELQLATCRPGAFLAPTVDGEDIKQSQNKKQKLSKQELSRQAIQRAASSSVALQDCVAHVLCEVVRVEEDDGHLLLRCSQLAAWCRDDYWDGRNFMPRSSTAPPYLTFLGSKVFGYVCTRPVE
ncbi:hypothetical protein P43SY_006481 [Pythium insidiosum]|uniref:Flavin reductase like domain-containing protein n=1 Tax=Pythium insidiosum TaxID=114742 RepID=A0AAD5Q581_PYTIN|nr:hypothetical protein P43SY_006481 [Pythium insidiosum]